MKLSKSQNRVLELVARYTSSYPSSPPPLYAPGPQRPGITVGGTRALPWRVREQLVQLGLIEIFDYGRVLAALGRGSVANFTFYRATPAGRAALKEKEPDPGHRTRTASRRL